MHIQENAAMPRNPSLRDEGLQSHANAHGLSLGAVCAEGSCVSVPVLSAPTTKVAPKARSIQVAAESCSKARIALSITDRWETQSCLIHQARFA